MLAQTGNPKPHKQFRFAAERKYVLVSSVDKLVLVIGHQRLLSQIENQLGLSIHRPIHTNPRFFAAGGAF